MYREDIVNVYQNGIAVKCPGLFQGEVLVMIEDNKKSLIFAMLATSPDLECMLGAYRSLVQSFPQCIQIKCITFILLHVDI